MKRLSAMALSVNSNVCTPRASRRHVALAGLFAMFFIVATSSATDATLKNYLASKDDPAMQAQINSYFLGAINAWVFANDTVSSVTGKQIFCVDESHETLSVKSARALLDARIATLYQDKKYTDTDTELHPIIFEALTNNFPCGDLSLFPMVPSASEGRKQSVRIKATKDSIQKGSPAAAPEDQASKSTHDDHAAVFSALDSGIPNWRKLNVQSEFLAWLEHNDPLTGETRQKTLTAAFNANDSHTVVALFNAYLQMKPAAH
jgi:hypothetical protein